MQLTDFLTLIAEALLIIALPIVIAAAWQHYRVMTQRLKAGVGEQQWDAIQRALTLAVTVAEETGLKEGLIGEEARQRAITFAQEFLLARGVKVDVGKLATLVESELRKQAANPTAPADTPMARQALLQSAIESAVLAAEKSGMTGLIQNTAIEKKNYALQMARQYMQLHGLPSNDQLMSGLIEAQLLKMYLISQGQTPPTATVSQR